MEETFNKLIIDKIDDFLDILQEITIRVNEDRIKYPEKYKNLTRFEIYENCRDLSIKYYDSIKGKDVLDFDDSIEEFLLNNEYNNSKYTNTLAIIRRGNVYFLYKMNLVATVKEEVINKYKIEHKVNDDIECIKFLPTNRDQLDEDLAELKKELRELQCHRFLVLYKVKSTDRCKYEILNVDTSDIDPDDRIQVKDKILNTSLLNPNEVDIISLIRDSSPNYSEIFENVVEQLNNIQYEV